MITPIEGHHYIVKHLSGLVIAKCLAVEVHNPQLSPMYTHRSITHYRFLNTNTNREFVIKSRVKIKGPADDLNRRQEKLNAQ